MKAIEKPSEETIRDLVTKILEIKSDALFPIALDELLKVAIEKTVLAEREEKERLEELLRKQVKCPKCNHKFVPEGAK